MNPPITYPLLIVLLVVLLAALTITSLLVGPSSAAGMFDLLALIHRGQEDLAWTIMREVRLPRSLLAVMMGATLGLAGAVLQGFLRNPLADPGIIGVSSGASLFAVVAFYSGLSELFSLALPLFAIAGALLSVFILQSLAGRGGVLTLILAGVAISSLAGAASQLVLNLSPNPYAATEIMFWLMGSITDRSMEHLALAAPFTAGRCSPSRPARSTPSASARSPRPALASI